MHVIASVVAIGGLCCTHTFYITCNEASQKPIIHNRTQTYEIRRNSIFSSLISFFSIILFLFLFIWVVVGKNGISRYPKNVRHSEFELLMLSNSACAIECQQHKSPSRSQVNCFGAKKNNYNLPFCKV